MGAVGAGLTRAGGADLLLLPKRLAWASEGTLKAVMVRAMMPAVVRNDAFMVSCEDEKNKQRQDDVPWCAKLVCDPAMAWG